MNRSRRSGRTCHSQFTIGVSQCVEAARCSENRKRDLLSEHSGRQIALSDIDQNARFESHPLPSPAVFENAHFVLGPPFVVVVDHLRQAGRGAASVLVDVQWLGKLVRHEQEFR